MIDYIIPDRIAAALIVAASIAFASHAQEVPVAVGVTPGFMGEFGTTHCQVSVSNQTDQLSKFQVWSEYSTNAGVWREFCAPLSYGLRPHSRDLAMVATPATWKYRITVLSSPLKPTRTNEVVKPHKLIVEVTDPLPPKGAGRIHRSLH